MKSSIPCRGLAVAVFAALGAILSMLTGCSAVTSSITSGMAGNLATAIRNQNDPETVRQGAPAYLLMVDGFIADDPENADVLMTGARLNSSYAGAFIEDETRAKKMALKARDYGWKALCLTDQSTCGIWDRPYEEFEQVIDDLDEKSLDALYVAAAAWAGWIQVNRDDWSAVADKARVEAMMLRVVALDESYDEGAAHLYLGVLATLLPKALGGQPEEGRRHFERAIELSQGRNLMAKLLLARDYARNIFDRELHDRLCREILDADPVVEGLTLSNTLAQKEARLLLDDSPDYFGE